MIDPITLSAAVSGATAAYNGIKKAIMMGREIEDLSSQLSTWMKAVSDVDNIHKNANNPSTFDKLFNGSVEEVAIESFASKKKLQKQREELKNFLKEDYSDNILHPYFYCCNIYISNSCFCQRQRTHNL
jgi:uncharacterized protein YpuA (DUF1002 family)